MADDERLALRSIEENLIRTDPAFAARMSAPFGAAPAFPWVSALCFLSYIVVPVEALLFGWRTALITLDLIAVIMMMILVRRRRKRRLGGEFRPGG